MDKLYAHRVVIDWYDSDDRNSTEEYRFNTVEELNAFMLAFAECNEYMLGEPRILIDSREE